MGQLLQLFVQEGSRGGEIHIARQSGQEKLKQLGKEAFQDVLPGFIKSIIYLSLFLVPYRT